MKSVPQCGVNNNEKGANTMKAEQKLYKKYLVDLLTIKNINKFNLNKADVIRIVNDTLERSADKSTKLWHEHLKLECYKTISEHKGDL